MGEPLLSHFPSEVAGYRIEVRSVRKAEVLPFPISPRIF